MTTEAQHGAFDRLGRLGVALAVLATLFAGLVLPLGGLLVGLSFAYIVWGDSPRMKYRFSMLAGISTIVWALYTLPLTGLFVTVSSGTDVPQVVHAAPSWTAPR